MVSFRHEKTKRVLPAMATMAAAFSDLFEEAFAVELKRGRNTPAGWGCRVGFENDIVFVRVQHLRTPNPVPRVYTFVVSSATLRLVVDGARRSRYLRREETFVLQ